MTTDDKIDEQQNEKIKNKNTSPTNVRRRMTPRALVIIIRRIYYIKGKSSCKFGRGPATVGQSIASLSPGLPQPSPSTSDFLSGWVRYRLIFKTQFVPCKRAPGPDTVTSATCAYNNILLQSSPLVERISPIQTYGAATIPGGIPRGSPVRSAAVRTVYMRPSSRRTPNDTAFPSIGNPPETIALLPPHYQTVGIIQSSGRKLRECR